jgi:CHAD domain-containing protein
MIPFFQEVVIVAPTKETKELKKEAVENHLSSTLGDYAYQIIHEQYRQIIKQEKKVLADQDPEHLHRMRVATRRLRTALQVFAQAVKLPKAASDRKLKSLAGVLGQLRDLDVQTADLTNHYRPQLGASEQKSLNEVTKALQKQRHKAFTQVEKTFERASYQKLKSAYEAWLEQPKFTSLAQLPLASVLPDLLSPLLTTLLLHPGWLISKYDLSEENSVTLHDLRKDCKHARYQAEFFTTFYHQSFKDWIDEVKAIQDGLGLLQDTHVLQALLADELPKAKMPELQSIIQQRQTEALANWEETRQKYLDPNFRLYLHQLILLPAMMDEMSRLPNGNGAIEAVNASA